VNLNDGAALAGVAFFVLVLVGDYTLHIVVGQTESCKVGRVLSGCFTVSLCADDVPDCLKRCRVCDAVLVLSVQLYLFQSLQPSALPLPLPLGV